jgi:hypothetical protein
MKATGIGNFEKEHSMKRVVLVVLFSVLIVAGSNSNLWAQDKDKPVEPVAQPKPPAVEKPITPLRVQVVFAEFDGDKKISSLPYTLLVNADEKGPQAAVRMGLRVPVEAGGNGGLSKTFNYMDVGTNLDGRADKTDDGRFSLKLNVEKSSLYTPAAGEKADTVGGNQIFSGQPIVQSFRSQVNLLLRDGQTMQSTVASDPINGHVLKVEVTLNVIK